MTPSESFDPRTWLRRDSTPARKLVTALKPAVAAPVAPATSGGKYRWWLGPVLSAAVLAGGAVAAYETRDASAVPRLPSAQ